MRLSKKLVIFLVALFLVTFILLFAFSISSTSATNQAYLNENHEAVYDQKRAAIKTDDSIDVPVSETYRSSRRTGSRDQTQLEDIFISIKTSAKFHETRLSVLVDTWIPDAIDQVYVFTDDDDVTLQNSFPNNHVINTHCSTRHDAIGLSCKMGWEFDQYFKTEKRWFCHMDDDNYVNIPKLIKLLQRYNHTEDWYLGKLTRKHGIEVADIAYPGQRRRFWFAHGGAGFCISLGLARKMMPFVTKGEFLTLAIRTGANDDCTVGYIINYLLHKNLTVIRQFHSHYEHFQFMSETDIVEAITISYQLNSEERNTVQIKGFSLEEDPTRFLSIHCFLKPLTPKCIEDNMTKPRSRIR